MHTDLAVTIDGAPVRPILTTFAFPSIERLRDGTGDIHIEYTIAMPPRTGDRTLVLANHHLAKLSVYLVNVLASKGPAVRTVTQKCDFLQLRFELACRRESADSERTGHPAEDNARAP